MQEQLQNKTRRAADAEIVENRTKLDTRARASECATERSRPTLSKPSRWGRRPVTAGGRRVCLPVAPGGPSWDADSRSGCDRRPRRQVEGQSSGWGCPTGGCQQRSWHCGQHGQHGGFIAGVLSGFSQGVITYLLFCASGE
jgi:hypothetical protein